MSSPYYEPYDGSLGVQFDAGSFVNSAAFNTTFYGVDHENINRVPTGSSVIDNESVSDDSGRTFHRYKEGKYFLPNDAAEQDRLDMQHAAITRMFHGRLHWAPVKDPKHVLDIATGTGIWANDFALRNPKSHVIGTDLSRIQPDWVAPNCTWIQDDAEEDWLYGTTDSPIQFDFIHLRLVHTCFNDPRKVMRHAFQNLTPGGWVEYCDPTHEYGSIDGNIQGTAFLRWGQLLCQGMALHGRDMLVGKYYKQWMIEEGFVDVTEIKFMLPGNAWPENPEMKAVGQFTLLNCHNGFRGVGWKVFKDLGLTPDEIEQLVIDAKRDAADPTYRWFIPVYVVFGRKPLPGETASVKNGHSA